MQPLPSSIEAYLQEAGFSPTELLVLKNLLEHDALTIRQLSAKTGKSAGVLDQAMKKLLHKKIVAKEGINDAPKYVLVSLDAVLRLLQEDTKQKRDMLMRRHENFEAFIASLKVDKSRPDMLYFDGDEGIKTAYMKLLEKGKKEMIQYFPVRYTEEEDPLREFREKLFGERRRRGIFARIIAHDTPLGRRFQTRDPYEYRQTLLIDESKCPFNYEKIIIGETVACFNHEEKRASFIEYPELAEMEKVFFERTWEMEKEKLIPFVDLGDTDIILPPLDPAHAPLKTKMLWALRESFLTKRSIAVLLGFAVLAACFTFGIQKYTDSLNLLRMKEKVQSIAVTAVAQIDPRDLGELNVEADWKKPEWTKVVNQLKDIRTRNSDLLYVYIFRKSPKDPKALEFVADSHSLNPYVNMDADTTNDLDVNNDGKIGTEDYLQWPGQPYPIPPPDAFNAFAGPTTSKNFYEDDWGKVISGYAPIKNKDGKPIAVIGVDMAQSKLGELSRRSFVPAAWFLISFCILLFTRIAVFERSILREIIWALKIRHNSVKANALHAFSLLAVALLIAIAFRIYAIHLIEAETGNNLMSIAATTAAEISPSDIRAIHRPGDMKKEEYQRMYNKLDNIQKNNSNFKYVYILRPTSDANYWEFVADADSNYFLPLYITDFNNDGELGAADEQAPPGTYFYAKFSWPDLLTNKINRPFYSINVTDQWGKYISGAAPIYSEDRSRVMAILGIDEDINSFSDQAAERTHLLTWFLALLLLLALLGFFRRKSSNN